MHRYTIIIISLLFLAYGLLRFGVGSMLFVQELGYISLSFIEEPLADIHKFLIEKKASQLITFSALGYVSYIIVMGGLLIIGALGFIKNNRLGPIAIGMFLGLYTLLFINFQTINYKIWHLIVCTLLFLIMLWAKKAQLKST